MDNYSRDQAHFSGGIEGEGIISRFVHNWQARKAVRELWQLDDHLLNDMGVTRDEVAWAAQRPLTVNAVQALEDRSLNRLRANPRDC